MKQKPLKIVLSGGGTGGHIFPAIAIADALKAKAPGSEFLFIGAKGRMEMEKVPIAGYPIKGLWISGLQRSLSLKNLIFPIKVGYSLFMARQLLVGFQPDAVIGVGGYASGPTLRMAIRLRMKTLIQEQSSYPGITNRLLSKKADKICVAFPEMDKWFPAEKTFYTGNPLRKSAVGIAGKRQEALRFFQITEDKPVILIIGGSQGARAINQAILTQISVLAQADVYVVWQTGKEFLPIAQQAIQQTVKTDQLKAIDFIHRMDLAYAAADIVVSRAGAISISELAVVAKPVIFVPLPTAAENHQHKNAMRLVEKDAAILVDNDRAITDLVPAMLNLAFNPTKQQLFAQNIAQFAMPDAADAIAEEILKLIYS